MRSAKAITDISKKKVLTMDVGVTDSGVNDSPTASADHWTKDMEKHEEDATDKILDHLIQSGSRPSVMITGDIVDIVTAITNALRQSVPPHLADPLKIMTDYIARWLCDYVEQANIQSLRVSFGFDARAMQEESA